VARVRGGVSLAPIGDSRRRRRSRNATPHPALSHAGCQRAFGAGTPALCEAVATPSAGLSLQGYYAIGAVHNSHLHCVMLRGIGRGEIVYGK
jgi:hypothetical protein